MSALSTIWENNDGCTEQYRCSSALYLMSVMSQCYSVIIDRVICAPKRGKAVVDGLNAIYKRYIYTNKCLNTKSIDIIIKNNMVKY